MPIYYFMYGKKPIALGVTLTLVGAINLPAYTDGEVCEADWPYRNQTCDAPGVIAVSTSTWGDTLLVVDNVSGELREASTPAVKFREYMASKFPPAKRPT